MEDFAGLVSRFSQWMSRPVFPEAFPQAATDTAYDRSSFSLVLRCPRCRQPMRFHQADNHFDEFGEVIRASVWRCADCGEETRTH